MLSCGFDGRLEGCPLRLREPCPRDSPVSGAGLPPGLAAGTDGSVAAETQSGHPRKPYLAALNSMPCSLLMRVVSERSSSLIGMVPKRWPFITKLTASGVSYQ